MCLRGIHKLDMRKAPEMPGHKGRAEMELSMGELKVGRMILGICQTNCYFVYREGSKEVICLDPADRGDYIYETLKEKGFEVAGILLTHGHFDHIWGSRKLRELSGAKIYAY